MTKTLLKTISDNIVWIIVVLMLVGGVVATFKQQSTDLEENTNQTCELTKRVVQLEINFVKFEDIREDIKDIKSDLRDIKKIVLKPAIGNNYADTNNILLSRR